MNETRTNPPCWAGCTFAMRLPPPVRQPRAQLKSLYSKLGVHDKAELTGYIVLND